MIKTITCEELYGIFKKNGFDFFTGVPDSTFKDWMKFLADEHGNRLTNIISCNECEAIAIATGYYLGTGKIAVAYMQNSGFGKTVNPLTSLCDPEVYSIPLLLMIGWRGEPGEKDEPQHKKMGRVMIPLLDALEIKYKILPDTLEEAGKVIEEMKKLAENNNAPVALIIKKNTFEEYDAKKITEQDYEMTREDAIKVILDTLDKNDVVVSTTGKPSRELFEERVLRNESPSDFYTVGGMGCCSSIANGIALSQKEKNVFIFDGDGAVLMQMGALATIGHYRSSRIYHIVFDNESHDSTGGQPTVSPSVQFENIALACDYKKAMTIDTKTQLVDSMKEIKSSDGPSMLIVKVRKGSRKDLGRPTASPIENKEAFIKSLRDQ